MRARVGSGIRSGPDQEANMMGFGFGGLWMILITVLVVLAIVALVKYVSKG